MICHIHRGAGGEAIRGIRVGELGTLDQQIGIEDQRNERGSRRRRRRNEPRDSRRWSEPKPFGGDDEKEDADEAYPPLGERGRASDFTPQV